MKIDYAPRAEVDVAITAEALTLHGGGNLARTFLARLDATAKFLRRCRSRFPSSIRHWHVIRGCGWCG